MNATQIIIMLGLPSILLDLISTRIGTSKGLKEGNPVGEKGVYIMGIVAIALFIVIAIKYDYGPLMLTFFGIVFVIRYGIAINNFRLIRKITQEDKLNNDIHRNR